VSDNNTVLITFTFYDTVRETFLQDEELDFLYSHVQDTIIRQFRASLTQEDLHSIKMRWNYVKPVGASFSDSSYTLLFTVTGLTAAAVVAIVVLILVRGNFFERRKGKQLFGIGLYMWILYIFEWVFAFFSKQETATCFIHLLLPWTSLSLLQG
jgi:hypothetical protein